MLLTGCDRRKMVSQLRLKVVNASGFCNMRKKTTQILGGLLIYFDHAKFFNGDVRTPMLSMTSKQIWNEYYQSLSTDKQLSAEVSEDMSRVSKPADTHLALDRSVDTASFDYRLMNGNNYEIVLSSFDKSVQLIGG